MIYSITYIDRVTGNPGSAPLTQSLRSVYLFALGYFSCNDDFSIIVVDAYDEPKSITDYKSFIFYRGEDDCIHYYPSNIMVSWRDRQVRYMEHPILLSTTKQLIG